MSVLPLYPWLLFIRRIYLLLLCELSSPCNFRVITIQSLLHVQLVKNKVALLSLHLAEQLQIRSSALNVQSVVVDLKRYVFNHPLDLHFVTVSIAECASL